MAITISGSGIVEANIADNAVTLAKMAGGTDGNIITYDTSGNPAVVATGSDGQILTSAGADAVPAFEAAPGGGLTGVDTWVLSTGFTGNADPLTSNLRRDDTSANSLIGTGMALDTGTGVWTFPDTGYWQVSAYVSSKVTATDNRYCTVEMDYTANNGTDWTTPSLGRASIANIASVTYTSSKNTKIFDITDTSNQNVRFSIFKMISTVETVGHGTENETCFTFIKLGDT